MSSIISYSRMKIFSLTSGNSLRYTQLVYLYNVESLVFYGQLPVVYQNFNELFFSMKILFYIIFQCCLFLNE